jgi:hypothetical protein
MNSFSNPKLKHILYLLLISIETVYTTSIFTKSSNTIPVIFVHWVTPIFYSTAYGKQNSLINVLFC